MQILHYCARLNLEDGGVVRAVLDLTTALSPQINSITLMSTSGTDWPLAESGVQIVQTGNFDKRPMRFSAKRLRLLSEHIEQADILHLHTAWEPANPQLANIALKVGTPYVISVHGMLDDWVMKTSTLKKKLFLALGGRTMFTKAASIHCTAQAEATQVRKRIKKANIDVVPLVFNPSQYLHPPSTSDPDKHWPSFDRTKPIILFLSRIHPKKGIERLIEAASNLKGSHDVQFIIAGSGEQKYETILKEKTLALGLESTVHFVGYVEGDRKTSLYRLADMFVLPTKQENFGIVFTEAMGCGLPVITTKGVDIWPELKDSNGALIIQDNADATTKAIQTLLDNPSQRIAMGHSAQQWVDQHFSGNTVACQYIDMYQKFINH